MLCYSCNVQITKNNRPKSRISFENKSFQSFFFFFQFFQFHVAFLLIIAIRAALEGATRTWKNFARNIKFFNDHKLSEENYFFEFSQNIKPFNWQNYFFNDNYYHFSLEIGQQSECRNNLSLFSSIHRKSNFLNTLITKVYFQFIEINFFAQILLRTNFSPKKHANVQ